MTDEQVRRLLGTPVSEGPGYPLFEESLHTMPEIGWWLNYENQPCLTQPGESVHLKAHVGLDAKGGSVVFVAGPTVESRGREILSQASSASEVRTQLGPEQLGWSADACYHYHPGVLVRGCGGLNTYYLRDWDAVGRRLDRINRERAEREFARMHKPARRPDLKIPPEVLTIREVYLGMPEPDLAGLGLPYEVHPGITPTRYYEVGDPRMSDIEQVSATSRNGLVTRLSGYQLERGGSVLLRQGDPQDRVTAALGRPDSVLHRSVGQFYQGTVWTYSDLHLEICVDPDGMVWQFFLDRLN